MIVLSLPAIATVVALGVIVFLWIGSAFMGYGMSGNRPESAAWAAGLGIGAIVAIALVIALAFSLYAVMFYAVSRVMFDSLEPVAALKESLAATRANLGAMLLFAGAFWLLCVLGFMVLSIIPLLGWMAWGVAVSALAPAAIYAAYRDVFGAQAPAPAMGPAP
jgi:hypothetical protein